jgi:hypothetical protein
MVVKYTYFYSYKCIMQIQLIYLKFNSEKLKTNYNNLLKILWNYNNYKKELLLLKNI